MNPRISDEFQRGQQAEAAKLDAATCLRQAQHGRQVVANLKELGYGG
jgi:hypothetical protein